MKKNDSIYQLILSIIFILLGGICFIPNVNFLRLLLCFSGIGIFILGFFFFIRGFTKEYDFSTNKILIITGFIVSLLGISFATLVWVFFNFFAILLSIIFIAYSLIGLIVVIKDKYGLLRVRIFSTIKNIIYISVGVLIIIDCIYHHMIIDYILGLLLVTDGLIGTITFISSYRIYHSIIYANHTDIDDEID
jgi:hypothetical protein